MRRLSAAQIGAAADAALDSSGESSGAEEDDEFGLPRRRAGPIVRSVSSELLDDMKPVVRESLNNLDDGMLKTLVAFCDSAEPQTIESFVTWLNSRGQVEVMLMWVESMSKVYRYQHDTSVPAS